MCIWDGRYHQKLDSWPAWLSKPEVSATNEAGGSRFKDAGSHHEVKVSLGNLDPASKGKVQRRLGM